MNTAKLELDAASTPKSIEARSFAIIDAETPEPRPFSGQLWEVARRCIHALGDLQILADLRLSQSALEAGLLAMRNKCAIFTDTAMLAAGLVQRRMQPLGITVKPLMALPGLAEQARNQNITRARAGIKAIAPFMSGQIIAIGNAPTALLALLEELEKGALPPALIVGMPVGFVNASQSKELLAASKWPHFTLLGRKGGSAAAAACINALAELLLDQQPNLAHQAW